MLQLDGISWKSTELGKKALLLEPIVESGHLAFIHRLFNQLNINEFEQIQDVVPAYNSIAIFHNSNRREIERIIEGLNIEQNHNSNSTHYLIEVDYEQGLDWDRVCNHTNLAKNQIIGKHSNTTYTVAMIGFLPGFVFLDGMDFDIAVPRLESPRIKIPPGSVGIGGNQTGFYSLESPGGWNIIGRTTQQIFKIDNTPPISILPGDTLSFKPVNSNG